MTTPFAATFGKSTVLSAGPPIRLDLLQPDVSTNLAEADASAIVDTIHNQGDLGVAGFLVILNAGGGFQALLLGPRGETVNECGNGLTVGPTDLDALPRCIGAAVAVDG